MLLNSLLKKKQFLILPAMLFLISGTNPAFAGGETPKQSVEAFIGEIRAVNLSGPEAEQKAQTAKANAYLDLEALSKKALTSHWESMSPEDRKAFLDLMGRLIEAVAYPKTRRMMSRYEVTYKDGSEDETGTAVESVIRQQEEGLDIHVIYHVHSQNGEWKIDDVILDDVSVTEDLQYQFDKIIADSGFSGLLQKMQERLKSANSEPSQASDAPAPSKPA